MAIQSMFERFSERARRIMLLAQEEAVCLNHTAVGPEHLLLGIIREGEGVACKVLESLGISPATIRAEIESAIGRGDPASDEPTAFTPPARKVLEFALEEARQLGHDYIGTEHLMLGFMRESEGLPARVLGAMGADLDRVRTQIEFLHDRGSSPVRSARMDRAAAFRRWLKSLRRGVRPTARKYRRAGAWLPSEVLAEIAERLIHMVRRAPRRAEALEALEALEWSFDLLSDSEQTLLRRLAIFPRSFSQDAAETMCAFAGIERAQASGLLTKLADKHLVLCAHVGDNRRFGLAELVRAYAHGKLIASGEAAEVSRRYLAWLAETGAND